MCSANIGFIHRYICLRWNWLPLWHDCAMAVSGTLIQLIGDALRWCRLSTRSSRSLKAENLFLRRQLALYVERGIKPRRVDPVTRISLAILSRLFNWREALVEVCPER